MQKNPNEKENIGEAEDKSTDETKKTDEDLNKKDLTSDDDNSDDNSENWKKLREKNKQLKADHDKLLAEKNSREKAEEEAKKAKLIEENKFQELLDMEKKKNEEMSEKLKDSSIKDILLENNVPVKNVKILMPLIKSQIQDLTDENVSNVVKTLKTEYPFLFTNEVMKRSSNNETSLDNLTEQEHYNRLKNNNK